MADFVLEGRFVLKLGHFRIDVSLHLRNAFTALFGPSGCGKTTTLKILAGLLKPASGVIQMHGKPLYDSSTGLYVPPEKRDIGLIFQESRLFPHLSVRENLEFALRQTPPHQRTFRFPEVVDLLGIDALLERYPNSLSGGETQRVALGRALLASPGLLLMDEPLAALDLPAKIGLLARVKSIHQEFGLPIVYVSHDLGMVMNIAEEVLLMHDGRIVRQGPAADVLSDYVTTSLLPGETIRNIIDVQIQKHTADGQTLVRADGIQLILPRLTEPVGEQIRIELPASEIILAVEHPGELSARNILPGRIRRILQVGQRVLVEVDVGIPLLAEIIEVTLPRLGLKPGGRVFLIIKATAFRKLNMP